MGKYKSIYNRSPTVDLGPSGMSPMDMQSYVDGQRSMIGAISDRLAIDVATGNFIHAVVEGNGVIRRKPESFLNHAFTVGPNINQTGVDFIMDIVLKMCSYGSACVVATKRDDDGGVMELSVGRPTDWYSNYVKVELFNNTKQTLQIVECEKGKDVAVLINPYYTVMNAGGSAIQRLKSKLNQIDIYAKNITSGKINGFVEIPHDVALDAGMEFAKKSLRRMTELSEYTYNKFGLIPIGAGSKVQALTRPIEPSVFDDVDKLHKEVYAQLGIPEDVFLGTATEEQIRAYQAGSVEIFWKVIRQGLTKTFLAGKTNEEVIVYRDMFSGVTGQNMGDMVDKLARNSMIDPNECRGRIGLIASSQPIADSLANKNMPIQDQLGGQMEVEKQSHNIFDSLK